MKESRRGQFNHCSIIYEQSQDFSLCWINLATASNILKATSFGFKRKNLLKNYSFKNIYTKLAWNSEISTCLWLLSADINNAWLRAGPQGLFLCVCVCVSVWMCSHALGGQKKTSGPWRWITGNSNLCSVGLETKLQLFVRAVNGPNLVISLYQHYFKSGSCYVALACLELQ